MVKKVTPAQLRSMIRRQQQQERQAINRYNRAVDKVNKANKKAVDEHNRQVNAYNRDVRAYNAAVRKNRQRLKTELSRLSTQKTVTTTYVVEYRQSFDVLQRASTRVEELGGNEQLLDLVEGEAANSAEVLNSLLEEMPAGAARTVDDDELADLQATSLGEELDALPADLQNRWKGALYALNPQNPDAARHFCTSAREILVRLVDGSVDDQVVIAAHPDCERKDDGKVARRAKITYCLARKNHPTHALPAMVEADVDNVLNLFSVVNGGTHGSAGRYDLDRLVVIKRRVEDALRFLHVLLN
ncbi:MAG TPA: hypothetical protein VF049_05130 [Nocardioidaceae bacterium]